MREIPGSTEAADGPVEGPSPDAPIGVFDSGVGGLTVARAIIDQLREHAGKTPVALVINKIDRVKAEALLALSAIHHHLVRAGKPGRDGPSSGMSSRQLVGVVSGSHA